MKASLLTLVAALSVTTAAHAQDGAAFFKQRCAMCHTIVPGAKAGIGPNLAGLVGRKAASTSYSYSAGLQKSGLTWDKATLDLFLTAPGKLVPGTQMVVSVPDPDQRAKLIAYLATLKK